MNKRQHKKYWSKTLRRSDVQKTIQAEAERLLDAAWDYAENMSFYGNLLEEYGKEKYAESEKTLGEHHERLRRTRSRN